MKLTARLQKHGDQNCREVIDDEHPVPVDAVGGQEGRGFAASCKPGDEGLISRAPGRQRIDPHGHQPFAAVMRVMRDSDESAMASTGGGHA